MPPVGRLPGPFLHDPATIDDKPAVWSLAGLRARLVAAFAVWKEETLAAVGVHAGETEFTLAETPLADSVFVFRSGVLEMGWTRVETTLTLAVALSAEDDLVVRYQYNP